MLHPALYDPSCVLALLSQRDNKWYDFSGNDNHGALNNAVFTSKGRFGPAIYFDGNDYIVQISHHASLIPVNISYEFWIYPINLGTGGQDIFAKRNDSNVGSILIDVPDQDDIYHFFYVDGSWYNVRIPYENNVWQHIVGSYDGETIKVYRNGASPSTNTSPTGDLNTETTDLYIGGDSRSAGGLNFNGFLDSFFLYNRALTFEEVKRNYALGQII